MVSAETLEKRAYVSQVLSDLLRLMGQGDVPLEFEEREDGQLAVALCIACEDSPLYVNGTPKRSPLLNALQFLLNRLLKRTGENLQTPAPAPSKVLLGVNGFPKRPSPPHPVPAESADASLEEASASPSCEKAEAISTLAAMLAQKCATHGRVYAVLLLGAAQQACMRQAASKTSGLSAFSEGEGHWSRLVFAPNKPVPMPQKSRISFDKEGVANKSPKALASLVKPKA